MCSTRPLNYDSLKTVIQWIDPNLRFTLSQRLPSIQAAERRTPLQMKNLFLGPNEVTVNNTVYSLRVIATGEDSEEMMQKEPEGFPHDLNKFGRHDYSSEGIMTPGDIRIIGANTEKYKELIDVGRLLNYLMDCLVDLGNLKDVKNYEYFMKFTTKNDSKVQRIEYLKTDKKVYEAMKFLTTKLLGRRCTLGVDNLKIVEEKDDHILRLPPNLKIATRGVTLGHNSSQTLDSIAPILQKSRISLQNITIRGYRLQGDIEKYNHPLIKSAGEVYFDEYTSDETEEFNWIEAILSMDNKTIHIGCTIKFTNEEYMSIANGLIKSEKPLGTHLMFDSHDKEKLHEFLYNIKDRDDPIYLDLKSWSYNEFDYCVILPIDNSKRLKIFVDNVGYCCGQGMILHFLIIDNDEFDRLAADDQDLQELRFK